MVKKLPSSMSLRCRVSSIGTLGSQVVNTWEVSGLGCFRCQLLKRSRATTRKRNSEPKIKSQP